MTCQFWCYNSAELFKVFVKTLVGKRGIGGVEEWDGGAPSNFTEKSSFNLILKDVSALLSRRHTKHCKEMELYSPGQDP